MSLVWTLRKWLDPEFRLEEEERRRLRETLMPTPEPSGGGEPPSARTPEPPADRVCRVCGHVGKEQEFCPSCLAGTMVPWR